MNGDESAFGAARTERTTLQTLTRALEVLDVVATGQGQATAKSIARRLGLRSATCYHILRTLKSEGYLVRVGTGFYDVGPRGGNLGHHLGFRSGPSPEILALLSRLNSRTRETVYVCGWYHGSIVMQQLINETGPVTVSPLDVGYSVNIHARASCKAVLAHLPCEIVETMFSGVPMPALTVHTTSSYEELIKELAQVRKGGYSLDLEGFSEGVCCISAPYFDGEDQPMGSFTVSVPSNRLSVLRGVIATEVMETASLASNLLRTGRLVMREQANPVDPEPPRQRARRVPHLEGGKA